MKCPTQSTDLNLIDNLWKIIRDKLQERKPNTVV